MLFELLKGRTLAAALLLALATPAAFAQDVAADQGTMPADAPRIAEEVFAAGTVAKTAPTPAEAVVETPFDGAMRQISAAQTACDEGTQHLGEGADRATVPACVAYDAMQTALWDHAVQVQEVLLAADLAGHVTTRANADRVRDDAMAAGRNRGKRAGSCRGRRRPGVCDERQHHRSSNRCWGTGHRTSGQCTGGRRGSQPGGRCGRFGRNQRPVG